MPSDDLLTRIDNLERLRCAATDGPWKHRPSPVEKRPYRCVYFGPSREEMYCTSALEPQDARFIAEVRSTTLLTEARDEIVRLRQALAMAELQRDLHKRTLDSTIKVITSKPSRLVVQGTAQQVPDPLKRSEHDRE